MEDFYSRCKKIAEENRVITDLDWDGSVEDILQEFTQIMNRALAGTDYYAERNTSLGEKNVNLFKKGTTGRVGHFWPRKRERVIHANFTLDIVEQLESKMDMPEDSDVKEGRYLGWRAYRGIDFATVMKMIEVL